MFKRYSITFFFLLLSSVTLYAQYGKISGTITDQESKEPLVGANVIIEGTTFGAATDITGSYHILNVPAGTYTVIVSYIGYQTTKVENIKVLADLTRNVDVKLSSTTVQANAVTIIAERPLIEKTATNMVRIQSGEELEKLPVRGVQGYFSLQPGVVVQNGTVYIRGGRYDEVGFSIEGANVRDIVGISSLASTNVNNTSNTNGNIITTIPEALEEISVQTGGFSAKYGGAMSGIVSQTFKTGGSDLKITLQGETDNFGNYPGKKFLNTYSYGYSDYVLTLGTPIIGDQVKLFVALENNFMRDRNPWFWTGADFGYLQSNGLSGANTDSALVKWVDGNVPGRSNNRYTGNGMLSLNLSPFQIRLSGAYTWARNSNNNLIRQIFDLAQVPITDNSDLLLNGKADYIVSENTSVEVNINYVDQRDKRYDPIYGDNLALYGDSVVAASHGYTCATLTSNPKWYNFAGFTFWAPGTPLTWYTKDKNTQFAGSAAFVTRPEKQEIEAGISYEYWSISHYDMLDPTTVFSEIADNSDDVESASTFAALLRSSSHVNNYGFDEFGNSISNGTDGPKHPYFFAAYVQDKVELSDINLNAGLRLDQIYLDGWKFQQASSITKDVGYDGSNYLLTTVKKGQANTYVSPRLGVSFPASDQTVFHLQFGKFIQAPPLYTIYKSQASTVYNLQGGHYNPDPTGFNVEPERTTSYEIGFSQQIGDASAFDITGFYKNVEGQLQIQYYAQPATSTIPPFYTYTNGDFTTNMGVELSLHMRRTHRFQAEVNYTLQDARGTNSVPSASAGLINTSAGGITPTVVAPLDYAQEHKGSVSLDYRWGKGDGGAILEQLGLNLLFTFNSGHPYTYSTGSTGQQNVDMGNVLGTTDTRSRTPLEPVNNSTTPWVFEIDLRIDKTFSVGPVEVNVYAYIQNLLNTQNVINVYYRTGNAYDDGWLSDPSASGKTVAQYGNTYSRLYNVMNLQNNQAEFRTNGFVNFATPRQIRIGAKIEL